MPPAKRVFLKRGEGTSRYAQGGMAEARQQYISKHNVSPVMEPLARELASGSGTRPVRNRDPPQTPEEELAEFEALEATVRRQSEHGGELPVYSGPTIEIYAPERPPPGVQEPSSADEWINGYDDDDEAEHGGRGGGGGAHASSAFETPSARLVADEPSVLPQPVEPAVDTGLVSDGHSPVQQGLEGEGSTGTVTEGTSSLKHLLHDGGAMTPEPTRLHDSMHDAPPSWSLLATQTEAEDENSYAAARAESDGEHSGGHRDAHAPQEEPRSSAELWSAYSIFHTTGGVQAADAESELCDARANISEGGELEGTELDVALDGHALHAEGLHFGSSFAMGLSTGSFATFDGSGGYGEPAPRAAPPIRSDEPPPTSALVSALFNQQHPQPSCTQHNPPSSRIPGRGRGGARGAAAATGRSGKGRSADDAQEAAAQAARDEESRKLRRRVAHLSEQLEISERSRAEAEAALQAVSTADGGAASAPSLSTADRERLQAEQAEFEEHKAAEARRLQRERRVLERQAKALLKVPDRKEREEVENLKSELERVKKEFAVREARFKVNVERLKKQLTTVEEQRDALKREVEHLEQARLSGISRSQSTVDRIAAAVTGAAGLATDAKTVALAAVRGHGAVHPSQAMDAAQAAAEAAAAAVMAATSSAGVSSAASSAGAQEAAKAAANAVMSAMGTTNSALAGEGTACDPGGEGHAAQTSERAAIRSGRLQPKGIAFDKDAGGARDWSFADDDAPAASPEHACSISGGSADSSAWMAQPRAADSEDDLALAEAEAQVAMEARQHHAAARRQQRHPTTQRGACTGMSIGGEGAKGAGTAAAPTESLARRLSPAEVLLTNGFFLRVALNADEGPPMHEDVHPDGKVERSYRSGRTQILYPTGTRKEVLPNGVQTVVFGNGDVKQTGLDRRVVYYYAEAATTHVSEPDGTQLYHFPNGQVERHFTDGLKEIRFTDGALKVITSDGQVQSVTENEGAFSRLAHRGFPAP